MAPRVLFLRTGFTTKDLSDYYDAIAPLLLPHLADRPLSLKRYPDDINSEAFWEKDAPNFTPAWVKRYAVPRKHENGVLRYIGIPDTKTLQWAASIGCIEIHPFLHRYPYITSPTAIAFDLDPGPGATATECCAVAIEIRKWFEHYKLECFAKFSGSKGVQVYVPLNTPTSYSVTQPLARHVAEELARRHPDRVTATMAREQRLGKVFIDWSQNADYKTTVSVYSLRAKHDEPFASFPLTWDEVKDLAKSHRHIRNLFLSPVKAIARVRELGDIFAPVPAMKQTVPETLARSLHLPPASTVPAVHVRKSSSSPNESIPRSSGQGGRKLFVIHRRGNRFEFGIEYNDAFFLFDLSMLPLRRAQAVDGISSGTQPLGYLTAESEATGRLWDLGTYEVIEGSLAKGRAHIYLSGRRITGAWSIIIHPPACTIVNRGARSARAGAVLKLAS
jgi:bifunctional non-homologous end joining protein LigD